MPDLSVCCVMLASGRQEMVDRAVRCFLDRTYPQKLSQLLIWDTGHPHLPVIDYPHVLHYQVDRENISLGGLRNQMNARANLDSLIHWDSDDWSHPNRIMEQIALLQASGADAVGYRDMLFWDSTPRSHKHQPFEYDLDGEAWLYSSANARYALGTSLCYWRRTWECHHFADLMTGSDTAWLQRVKCQSVTSMPILGQEPRMIASIHGANTAARIVPGADEWRRVPEWDIYLRQVMKL